MIIFDLDTLANCEHRRHFVDPKKNVEINHKWIDLGSGKTHLGIAQENGAYRLWQPDWQSFYAACDKDKPIYPTIGVLKMLIHCKAPIQIWSGRCDSVRAKTNTWILLNITTDFEIFKNIKMRPEGDLKPDHELFENWIDDTRIESKWGHRPDIDMVFSSNSNIIKMFRDHGIFVFDCNQDGKEF